MPDALTPGTLTPDAGAGPKPAPSKLRRRDVWLLPLVSLVTVLVMLAGAELLATTLYPEQDDESCTMADPVLKTRNRPNCTSTTKVAEGPWITNSFNACGYRTKEPCGPALPGTKRIALIGSSLSAGMNVPYEDTIGARLAVDLTQQCGTPVEVQNLARVGYTGAYLVPRMKEALQLAPKAVVLVTAPHDLEFLGNVGEPAAPEEGVRQRLFNTVKRSRALLMLQSRLFRNPGLYIPLYLRYGDRADFMRPPFTEQWQTRINTFDALLAQLSGMARAAGVPFMLVYAPQEAQAALLAQPVLPPGVDPLAFDRALGAIAAKHGMLFHDVSLEFRTLPAPQDLFYRIDGHISGLGQPLIAEGLAHDFAAAIPGFAECRRTALSAAGKPS